MSIVSELSQQYLDEVSNFVNSVTGDFLDKNNIPHVNLESTKKILEEKGYRVIDEIEKDEYGDVKHTLLFLKVVDQTHFTIRAPKFEIK